MSDLDLRKLRSFLVIAEELNLGRAAERLHVTQPSLSRQMSALEAELGIGLFDRQHRSTRLTAAGEAFVDEARAVVNRAVALQNRTRRAARGEALLSIGFPAGVILTPALRRFAERFPGVATSAIRTTWREEAETIRDGRVDVGVVHAPIDRRLLTVVPMALEERRVALPALHPLASADRIRVADLAAFDLLHDADSVPEWRDAVARTRPRALGPARLMLPSLRSVEDQLEHVAAGAGIAVVTDSVARFFSRPDVAYRPVEDLEPAETALAFEAGRSSEHIDAFVEIMRAVGLGSGDLGDPLVAGSGA